MYSLMSFHRIWPNPYFIQPCFCILLLMWRVKDRARFRILHVDKRMIGSEMEVKYIEWKSLARICPFGELLWTREWIIRFSKTCCNFYQLSNYYTIKSYFSAWSSLPYQYRPPSCPAPWPSLFGIGVCYQQLLQDSQFPVRESCGRPWTAP
jgi:hypothetical protein